MHSLARFLHYSLLWALLLALAPARGHAQSLTFAHPGSLHPASDMANSLALASQGLEPWKSGLAKVLARIEGPNNVLDHYDLEAPSSVFERGSLSLFHDADVAHTCALYWFAFKDDPIPAKRNLAIRARGFALEIIGRWTQVQVDDSEQYTFAIGTLLLAADLLGGGELVPGFRFWLFYTVFLKAYDQYLGVITGNVFFPRGQNHSAWGLYAMLLVAHLLDSADAFNDVAHMFASYALNQVDIGEDLSNCCGTDQCDEVSGCGTCPAGAALCWHNMGKTSYNDATLGNERERGAFANGVWIGGSGVRYTFVALMPVVAIMRVIKNVSSENVFDALPDAYDTSGAIGRDIRRAIQTAYYYVRHVDRFPYNSPPEIGWEHGGHFFDIVSAIYQNAEYAAYARPDRPYQYDSNIDSNVFRSAGPHASYLLSAASLSIDMTAPGTQTFESGPGLLSAQSGLWGVARESESPAGNQVYRQTQWRTAATSTMGGAEWMDYGIRARIKVHSFENANAAVGLYARYNDGNNYYSFMWSESTRRLRIEKRFNGVQTVLASTAYDLRPNAWYTFKVLVDGPRLNLWVSDGNGSLVTLPAVDEFADPVERHAFLAGKVGLQAHRADASFENVCVSRNGASCDDAESFLPPSLIMSVSP